jgi:RNA polymerase sigma factor (sigma-70 family)
MHAERDSPTPTPAYDGRFATTRWSLVARATCGDATAHAALGELCERYWEPIYAYIRRTGKSPDDAADLTQGFIARLIDKADIAGADQNRGRFRSFLLGAVKHYILNESTRARAAKRGGTALHVELDYSTAEQHYVRDASTSENPETLFLRRWALRVLDDALRQLKARYESEGKLPLFVELSPHLSEDKAAPYAEIGKRLAMKENAVKVAAHRLRTRYRDTIRAAVADTLQSPEEIDDEIRFLIAALEK